MKEEWKNIIGYEGIYEVSNKGNVRSLDRTMIRTDGRVQKNKGCSRKLYKGKVGYFVVTLLKNGKQELMYVHRLVAESFIELDINKNFVNHKDGNKLNNSVNNLEWVTQVENNIHAFENGLSTPFHCGENNNRHKLNKTQVEEILELYKTKTKTQLQISEMYGVCRTAISLIVNKNRWKHVEC